jgi:lipoprotein-anchoring transpeptidase ErfK/SrfK
VQVLGSRRGGLITLILVAAAIVVAGTFLIFQFADRPRVDALTPAPGAAVDSARQMVAFEVDGDARMSDLRVTVDGRDVTGTARADGAKVMVPVAGLDDGEHAVAVTFSSPNVFARTVASDWTFEVDTVAPPLTISEPAPGSVSARRAVRFTGTSEPGATITLAHSEGEKTITTGPRGGWTTLLKLPEGVGVVTVTASDRAGNTTARGRRTGVDTTPPNVLVSAPADGEALTQTDEPLIYGRVTTEDPRALTYAAIVNGTEVLTTTGAAASASADETEVGYTEASGTDTGGLQLDGRKFALSVGALPQGRNRVTVVVTDAAGNQTRMKRTIMVDTTDTFGSHDLVVGARGDDVKQLQELLREAGVFPKKANATGVFDKRTVKSVRIYQRSRSLPVNGRVDERMRSVMVGRIVVSLSQFKLSLIRGGKVVKTYPIAIGQAAYPTPTGDYEIIQKQVDPTWFPPSSPWAEGLGPIPPGPGNPLGTRWIGTSAPAIGIHGTYAPSSIGTAASHGCMRMHIADVEELYDEVSLGMKVSIRP